MHTDHHSINTTLAAPRFAIGENVALTMSSREMSELTGKRHDSVKRTIETLAFKTDKNGDPAPVIGIPQIVEYLDTLGRPANEYHVSKRDSFVVVAQLCPEFTAALVDRWQELEAQAKQPRELSRMDLIQMALASEQETLRVTAERDLAIATKALIGSKREATAMATASAKSREVATLRAQLGINERHATIIAVERATGLKFPKNGYVPLRRWCKAHDVEPEVVVDPRYGTVKAWPAAAWRDAHAIDLSKVFGGAAQ